MMGCLGTRYVHSYVVIITEEKLSLSVHFVGSIICSCIMMWTYRRLNKEKEELCAREGIHESMKDMYRDLADKSPLFR